MIANVSKPFDTFFAKIWVRMITTRTNETKSSIEKTRIVDAIIKNQNENPMVTVSALNRGDDNSILDRID